MKSHIGKEMVNEEFLAKCGFGEAYQAEGFEEMSFSTFLSPGNLLKVQIRKEGSSWQISRIVTTGKKAFETINTQIPNFDVIEAAELVRNISDFCN